MSSPRVSLPLRVVSSILAVVVTLLAWGETVRAREVLHKDLQVVNPDTGLPNFQVGAGTDKSISLIGVVINNPWNMLNSDGSVIQPQWQVFIQAISSGNNSSPGDYGGTALYMRKNMPGPPDQPSVPIYDLAEWEAEMLRLNYPKKLDGVPVQSPLRRGDVIRVDAGAPGMPYGGKFNINERHSKDVANDFNITILERDAPLTAASIMLSDVKDSSNNFLFDADRLIGAEHYQGSLVHLDNLMLADDPSKWIRNGIVKVQQDNFKMDLKLGLDPDLESKRPTADTKFSITAIFDQESADPKSGYRLWLTNAGDFSVVPEPSTVVLVLLGGALMVPVLRRRGQRVAQN